MTHQIFIRSLALITFLFAFIGSSFRVNAAGLDLNADELKGTTTKKPVAVVQNRYFLKSWRPELGFLIGTVTNEAYTDTQTRGLRLGVFLNEWVGLESQWIRTTVKDSADRKALKQKTYRDKTDPNKLVTADAEVNPISSMNDFVMIAAPLYGKVNIFDLALVYIDIYGSLGISRVGTEQGTKNAIAIGGGQRFYFADNWSARLDFRDRTYTETRGGQNSKRNAWTVDLGVSYLFL
jgi:outer membrane beta-barrel protein